ERALVHGDREAGLLATTLGRDPSGEVAPERAPLLPSQPAVGPASVRIRCDRDPLAASVLPGCDQRRLGISDADVAPRVALELGLDDAEHVRPARLGARDRTDQRRIARRQRTELALGDRLLLGVRLLELAEHDLGQARRIRRLVERTASERGEALEKVP